MLLFVGSYENKVDGKGRVSLPAPFRDRLTAAGQDGGFYIFPSPNSPSLEAVDESFMERVATSIEKQTALFSDEEEALSQIISEARPVSYDSTGRFVLPPQFQTHAGISEKALFVAKVRRFQIWDPAAYAAFAEKARGASGDLSLNIGG